MKLAARPDAPSPLPATHVVDLPDGLIGFPELIRAELLFLEDQLPFLWLREDKHEGIAFLVFEGIAHLENYHIELQESDVTALGLQSPDEALVLNIVTLPRPPAATILTNLVGPVVVNRRTRVGRQVIIGNFESYSARHVLQDGAQTN